jgi:hypothetical protein
MLVYLEKLRSVHQRRQHRKSIVRAKLGGNPIIAYDESTRMLLICVTSEVRCISTSVSRP